MALCEVNLIGALGRKFIQKINLDIKTPREAIRAIEANFPGFYGYIQEMSQRGFMWRVLVGGVALGDVDLETYPTGSQKIQIVPVVQGSGAVGRILLGVAIIGAGLLTGGTTLLLLGGAVALSGFSALFNPPKNSATKNKQNSLYSGAENTLAVGNRIPIVLGRLRVGSSVISADVVSYQL